MSKQNIKNLVILSIIALVLIVIAYKAIDIYSKSAVKEKRAQSLKINKSKKERKAKSWTIIKKSTQKSRKVSEKEITAKPDSTEETNLWDQSTEKLAEGLEILLGNISELELTEIDYGISIADEILLREPDAYSAYKAKLILTLSKEGLTSSYVDSEVDFLIDELASFDTESDQIIREEAFLMARDNSEEELILDEDLFEIWFQRTLAKEDYDFVIDEAEYLIEDFPNSLLGYQYLIRALDLAGRADEADEYISDLELSETQLKSLELKLKKIQTSSPKDYWKQLTF